MELKEMITERLALRPITEADWKNYVSHVISDNEVYVQYGYEPEPSLIEYIQNPTPEVIYYSIILKDTDEMVGYIGITETNNNIEFYTFKECRNNHYCSEALNVFMEMYLNGEMTGTTHESIIGETIHENEASIHLLEKAGFVKEAWGMRVNLSEDKVKDFDATGILRYEYTVGEENDKRRVLDS